MNNAETSFVQDVTFLFSFETFAGVSFQVAAVLVCSSVCCTKCMNWGCAAGGL